MKKTLITMVMILLVISGCRTQIQHDTLKDMSEVSAVETNNKNNINPIIYLTFDEKVGTIVKDSSKYLKDGYINYIFNVAKYQPNREPQHTDTSISGGALVFDGYSTFIEYEDVSLDFNNLSCSVWVAPRAFEWGDKGLPSTIISQYDTSKAEGFQFGIYRHGSYGVELQTQKGRLKLESVKIEDFIPKYEWSHLAFTYNARTSTLNLYRNGELMMSDSIDVSEENAFNSAKESLFIGKNSEGASIATFSANMFNGVIDELKLYDKPLSNDQIKLSFEQDLEEFSGEIPHITYKDIALNSDIVKDDINRPTFHIGAPQHWMNEPHGIFYYKDKYHLFYQHNPYGPYWHEIHWGHLVSMDMIHWEYLPDALSPTYNSVAPDGIWSGSSVLDRHGNPVIFYTAGDDSMTPNQNVAIARPQDLDDPNLIEWVMEPVLTIKQDHGQGEFGAFRDPYVWFDKKSDFYYLIIGTGTGQEGGTALIYKSYDLNDWIYHGPFLTSDYNAFPFLGQRWELPMMMEFIDSKGDEKDILLFSPHGDGADIEVYYFTGIFDRDKMKFIKDHETPMKIDLGNGVFTGPSGFMDPISGKNILFTIAQGERDSWSEYYAGWAHNGGMPLELTLNGDDELQIKPISAIEDLRYKALVSLENISVKEANDILRSIKGDAFDINIIFGETQGEEFGIHVRMTDDQVEDTFIYYDQSKKGLYINRLHSSLDTSKKDVVGGEYTYEGSLELRILLDRSLIEVYAHNTHSLTARVYPTLSDANGLRIESSNEEAMIESLIIYPMKGIY